MTPEHRILISLLETPEFVKKVIPFIKSEYFSESLDRKIFEKISEVVQKYNTPPTPVALQLELEAISLNEHEFSSLQSFMTEVKSNTDHPTVDWLVDFTEKFCQDRALHNALHDSIDLLKGTSQTKSNLTKNAIPDLLRSALSVDFKVDIGHDYMGSLQERFAFYRDDDEKIKFDLKMLNQVTGGGIPRKTLSCVAAGTGVGKTIFLCHHAANCLQQNLNVLYITMELSEHRIAERIDANLTKTKLSDLRSYDYYFYEKAFKRATSHIKGKLIIKEYPPTSASSLTFKCLLDELKLKSNFIPDVIIVDYINLCASSRYKAGNNVNSYTLVKAISEELRAIAVETNTQVFTATQLNRSGYSSTDIDFSATSESMGLPFTTDFFIVLMQPEDLEEQGQVLVKQLKNRFDDMAGQKKFLLGLDKAKMLFYDVEDSAQGGISQGTGNSGITGGSINSSFGDLKKYSQMPKSATDDWE